LIEHFWWIEVKKTKNKGSKRHWMVGCEEKEEIGVVGCEKKGKKIMVKNIKVGPTKIFLYFFTKNASIFFLATSVVKGAK